MTIKQIERIFRFGNDYDLINRVITNVIAHQWDIQNLLKDGKREKAIHHVDAVIYELLLLEGLKLTNLHLRPEDCLKDLMEQVKAIRDYMEEHDGISTLPMDVNQLHMYLNCICDDLQRYTLTYIGRE